MKYILFGLSFLSIVHARAVDCNNPPTNGFGAGYAAYASWCTSCGGSPSSSGGVSCTPGPNWGNAIGSEFSEDVDSNFLLDFASGGAYSREKEMERGEKMNQKAFENFNREEQEKRKEIHSRLVGQIKMGESATEGYSVQAVKLPNQAGLMPHQGPNSQKDNLTCRLTNGVARADQTQKVCAELTCGKSNMPVCCPPSHPILNQCDCKCYNTSEFACQRYANCNVYEVK